ncbi:portal protein [Mesorhizobium sp. M1403]|uniref:portal protein n=1 Tax=Mesorhizobium sp. M1403 TaxID=2957097 RepID=UPI003337E84B
MPDTEVVSAKALYETLATERDPYIKRAVRAAELTVPYLFPKVGTTGSTTFVEPNQSLGARGLRHLASKLQVALFPVNAPFFKYEIDDLALANLAKADNKRGEIEKALSARERAVLSEMNGSMFRPVSFEVFRQLLLAGNCLLHIPKKGKPRAHRLSSYVVQRDASGTILDIVLLETIARTALPADIMAKINAVPTAAEAKRDAKVDIYTHITLDETGQKYNVTQEIEGVLIEGEASGFYPKDKLPWIPLRFTYIEGEDYGRGFIDEYIGDLANLDALTAALRDGTIQGAKVIWLVAPNSTVKPKQLADAANGGFVQAEANAVVPLRLDKQSDFAVAERMIGSITERLQLAFLLHSQREGERVTAEEIKFVAGELDQGLGGVYSLLAEEYQQPVAVLYSARMEFVRKVPPLPKEITSTTIVTGIDALGRGSDLQKLDTLIAGSNQVVGPEQVGRYLNVGEYFKRRGAAIGIDMGGLIKSDEEIAEADQQAQMMALAQNLGPQAITQMGGLAKEQMNQNATEGEPNG